MDRKIGEVFECAGVHLMVVPFTGKCRRCFFFEECIRCLKSRGVHSVYKEHRGPCHPDHRTERNYVMFIPVEDL